MLTTATLMPTVPTPKDRSTARVIRDTLEMESRVLVSLIHEITDVTSGLPYWKISQGRGP